MSMFSDKKKSEDKKANKEAMRADIANRPEKSDAEILKMRAKRAKKDERFIRTRMWISILAAKYFRDRGVIPKNIGNNIFIGNNQITTKQFMTCAIYIQEFSNNTPIGFQSDLISRTRDSVKNATIDFTVKMYRYQPDLSKSGMDSRKKQWERTLDAPFSMGYMKERAARCLYTMEILNNRVKCFKAHTYILVRSDNGYDLDSAVGAVKAYLFEKGIKHKEIRDDMELHFQYICMMSDRRDPKLRDLNSTIYSTRTLAETLPMTQGMNDKRGFMMGFDIISKSPYYIDVESSSGAKNFLVVGPSGFGKTFLVITWCQDRYAENFNLLIRDLKGNEFDTLTAGFGGETVSMSEEDLYYINFFNLTDIMHTGGSKDFRERLSLCERLMYLVCNPTVDKQTEVTTIIGNFITVLFKSLGVVERNSHTWARTADLNPYTVFEKFKAYAGPELRTKYGKTLDYMLDSMSLYMSENGTKSHIFRMPMTVTQLRETKVLRFNFGMLEAKATYDETIFKIKLFLSDYIADDYIAYKKSKGEWTAIVDEEAQLASEEVSISCKKDGTMRRSQNVILFLLCNSVASIAENPNFAAVLSNTKILCIGNVTETDRKYLIKEYSLDKYESVMEDIENKPAFHRTFLLVNRLQPNSTTALLQACIPEDIAKGKMFTVVDVREGTESVSGIEGERVTAKMARRNRVTKK